MMSTRTVLTAIFLVLTAAIGHAQGDREITKITGDLYRFHNVGHFSVFLVTPAGIIATGKSWSR